MATNAQVDQSDQDAVLGEVLKNFAQDEKAHDSFCTKVEERYKAYRAVLEIKSKAAGWTSRQHPPYIFQVIETMLASVVDPNPTWRVRPRPQIASPEQIMQLKQGAKANELLLDQQADCDHFGEKQIVFAKQCLVAGLSVYKTFWNYSEAPGKRQALVDSPVYAGEQMIGTHSRPGVQSYTRTYDDNTAEVVDVRDFIWHEAAVSLEKAKRVTHRILYSMEDLKALERAGVYKNVSKLYDTDDTSPAISTREQDLFESNRAKDMVEVLEQWRRTDDGRIKVTSIGNRSVLLRDKPNPFWHDQFPFVICSSVPDLFRIPGISEVELLNDLQELLWTMMNQRIDNTHLLNNAIVLIREDADDYEQFEWAPGAQWVVQDPQQVSILPINPAPAEISIQAETRALQDLQNISGASPALLGQMDNSANTATEVSLTSSLGQRRFAAKKQQFKYCHNRVGLQWLANNQQFLREDRAVAVIGEGGEAAFEVVKPMMIQGDYVIEIDAMDDQLSKQQKQADAQSTFQVALAAAPVLAALAQQGQAQQLNFRTLFDDVLEAKGITDTDRYYLPPQQSPALPPGQQQAGGLEPGPGGVTAPEASGPLSPSNANTQNPAASMQRMLAMGGGPSNAPAA